MLTNYVATARYRAGLPTPLVVRGPCGGYVRGGAFHSPNVEAAFFHTPGLKIVYPATARDAKGLIKASIRGDDPVIYLEHKWLYRRIKEQLTEGEEVLTPIGEARLARAGTDLSIVTYGATVWKSLEAADQLAQEDGVAGGGAGSAGPAPPGGPAGQSPREKNQQKAPGAADNPTPG